MLGQMGLTDAGGCMPAYPAQLSGGQRQRVVLAMALATDPVLLLADEPTSSLDVRTQAQMLSLLADVASRRELAILLVSHDFGSSPRYAPVFTSCTEVRSSNRARPRRSSASGAPVHRAPHRGTAVGDQARS